MSGPIDIHRLLEVFDVDVDTGIFRRRFTRGGRKKGEIAGGLDARGYVVLVVDGVSVKAHRAVFAVANGYWPEVIDHIDGNPANNSIANLRAATHGQNSMNRRRRADNTSGVKGVVWAKKSRKWEARCGLDGRFYYVGQFDVLADAAEALRSFRRSLHGEFARHE